MPRSCRSPWITLLGFLAVSLWQGAADVRGQARSGAARRAAPAAKAGTWAFVPERDTFRRDALFDLRGLNEKTAGEGGFLRLSEDGNSIVLGDGKPIRIWAANTNVQEKASPEELARHARFLAKRGVNMVRIHGSIVPKEKGSRLTDADPKYLEAAWKLVAAMKKEGIYVTLSAYWANPVKVQASWGIDGLPEGTSANGVLFFNPALQEGYRAWLKALLATPNPHTGIPLAKDPALGIIQLQNEDSLLFWTAQNLKGRQLELLGELFGRWLAKKYGSLEAASRAWGNDGMDGDDFPRGVVGIHLIWELTQPRQGGRKRRLDDQLQFLAETMYRFNQETARYLREDLGCRQLINPGNWRTADTTLLNDAERWSYTANEVLALNSYYSPPHIGPDSGWRIDKGDRFVDESMLFNPLALPLDVKQVAGHPMLLTESHWVPPLGYQSEGPFLVAAYQSLTGLDGYYWFAAGDPEWSAADRSEWDAASRKKWDFATPMELGQFPAAALIYRKGMLKQGEPVVVEHRSLDQIWRREAPLISEEARFDPNRDEGETARRSEAGGKVDPFAFLAGPVQVVYDSNVGKTRVADLKRLIDHRKKVVRAETGEVTWDYGRGICAINAPMAQGATGFLSKVSSVPLKDVTIVSGNDYATVLAVSLDDRPLRESRRILVQVGTQARPTGWIDRPADFKSRDGKQAFHGKEIVSTGKMPWAIRDADVTLKVANAGLKSAARLDANGNRVRGLKAEASGGSFSIKLPKDSLYAVLEGE
ncbi:hypothetical protein OJF2_31270 [Aquisphaera giovannonii]|uniref:Glycoside hydrolase family 42 N-terminal domain-containing protein n=1 Tax=Aquisphaera giovannonii TaxID=406548 RepID=A0A5B9W1W0_9BACT|nr:hypothetical protein [Aquisphaera giovannonii]QEH34586.1 hypothetical protein OJF2_31270 [Aquisphaera giovannonii]